MKLQGLIKESILPAFWVVFFMAFSLENNKSQTTKNTVIKTQDDVSTSHAINFVNDRDKNANVSKTIYLSKL